MKKSVIWGLALLLVGALLFSVGYVGSGMDLSAVNGDLGPMSVRVGGRRGNGGESIDGRYDAPIDSITYIELVESNTGVVVTASPDGQIHLRYQVNDGETMEINTNNGKLTMKRQSRAHVGIFFWFPETHTPTELQLPEGLAAEVVVKSFNAGVTAEGLTLNGRSEFSTSNGNLTAENLSAADLTLKTSNGTLTAGRVRCADAALTNSNGGINAEGFDCDTMEAKTSNGKLTLSQVSGTTVYGKTSNSTVEVVDISAGESIELHNSNGNIKGTLSGSSDDYRIESKTSNGSNNLPNDWGKGSILLTVTTSNGSIDLQFAED